MAAPPKDPQIQEAPIDVELSQIEPATPTTEMLLRAELRRKSYVEEVTVGDDDGTIELRPGKRSEGLTAGLRMRAIAHRRSRNVRLYNPNGTVASVPAPNMDQCLEDGWSAVCFKCHTDCGGSDWGCGKQPEPKFLRCEVCRRKIHDLPFVRYSDDGEEPDPNQMENPWASGEQGAQMGAKAAYLGHMWAYHRDVALAMGLPTPEAH